MEASRLQYGSCESIGKLEHILVIFDTVAEEWFISLVTAFPHSRVEALMYIAAMQYDLKSTTEP